MVSILGELQMANISSPVQLPLNMFPNRFSAHSKMGRLLSPRACTQDIFVGDYFLVPPLYTSNRDVFLPGTLIVNVNTTLVQNCPTGPVTPLCGLREPSPQVFVVYTQVNTAPTGGDLVGIYVGTFVSCFVLSVILFTWLYRITSRRVSS